MAFFSRQTWNTRCITTILGSPVYKLLALFIVPLCKDQSTKVLISNCPSWLVIFALGLLFYSFDLSCHELLCKFPPRQHIQLCVGGFFFFWGGWGYLMILDSRMWVSSIIHLEWGALCCQVVEGVIPVFSPRDPSCPLHKSLADKTMQATLLAVVYDFTLGVVCSVVIEFSML